MEDGTVDPAAEVDAVGSAEPELLVLGENVAGQQTPADFVALVDGHEMALQLGQQGLYMVVVAFRTRDLFGSVVEGEVALTVDGLVYADVEVPTMRIEDAADGWAYVYDIFVVVDGLQLGGKAGTLELTVWDSEGVEATVLRPITLAPDPVRGQQGG